MGISAFLDQLHWYELFGGFIACIILAVLAFYALGFTLFMSACAFYHYAAFRVAVFLGIFGGAGWFIYNLIQKYGA